MEITGKKLTKLLSSSAPAKNLIGKQVIKDTASIGILVKRVRLNNDLSQAQAAAMCRVGTRFFSDLENGKVSLRIGMVLQVLTTFGLVVTIKRRNSE